MSSGWIFVSPQRGRDDVSGGLNGVDRGSFPEIMGLTGVGAFILCSCGVNW